MMMSHSVVDESMRLRLFTFSCFARKYEYGTEHVFLRLKTDRVVIIFFTPYYVHMNGKT